METKSEIKKTPVYYWLIATILTLIIVQIVMVKGYGVKHIFIKAGYYEPLPEFETGDIDAARERLLWLENQLAPPPLLVWSDKPPPLIDNRDLVAIETDISTKSSQTDLSKNKLSSSVDLIETPLALQKPITSMSNTTERGVSTGHVIEVAAHYVRQLPDLRMVEAKERKSIFISMVLPQILRSNQELLERRHRIMDDYEKGSYDRIKKWAELYAVDDISEQDIDQLYDELMLRVDEIPVSLALAQAIVESGWGTSRFARQGNALFGEWAWSESQGIKPLNPSNGRAVVRSFVSIFDSVRSYMHNLNTHDAYQRFRESRKKHRSAGSNRLTQKLIPTLDKYAQDGDLYIRKLHNIVKTNNLEIYNNAELAKAN